MEETKRDAETQELGKDGKKELYLFTKKKKKIHASEFTSTMAAHNANKTTGLICEASL
jgi:hypothetical protein